MDHSPLHTWRAAVTFAGIAVPLALTAASLVRPLAVGAASTAILAAGLMVGGPHGAFDHRVVRLLVEGPGRTRSFVRRYALAGAAVTVAFAVAPQPVLAVLLVVSVAHFAEGDADWAALRDHRLRDHLDSVAGWVSGTSAVLLPLTTHSLAATRVLSTIAGHPLPRATPGMRDLVTATVVVAASLVAARLRRAGRGIQALEVLAVIAVCSVAPPGAAIGVVFAAGHSARHAARLYDLGVLRPPLPLPRAGGGRAERRPGTITGLLGPLLLTLAAGAAVVGCGVPWLRVVVGGMLALTVPHAVAVAALDRRRPTITVARVPRP